MKAVIFLYGAPASGKTTCGRMLAEKAKLPFFDLDEEIVRREHRGIPEIFAASGEGAFRAMESAALRDVLGKAGGGAVVSLGGGTLLDDDNRLLCESHGDVWCIDAPSPEELARRIGSAEGSRPLGDRSRQRAGHYASFAHRLSRFAMAGDSLVLVGSGIAGRFVASGSVVADETVRRLYSIDNAIYGIPSGERHKTIATVGEIWSAFARAGLGRRDVVTAVGGGVAGDMTGFAAATWMRGIDWINVPTTLLSMVDASTGGKTGCDLKEGKNLAGAFHVPRVVVIDTDFLKTLSPELVACGRAEMIKHEIIGGLARGDVGGIPTAAEIAENLSVKIGIVAEDPYERNGRRLLLNCGHTVAHAVEKLTDYALTHGEAVSIGCVEEARIACRFGLAGKEWPAELAGRFAEAGLPTELPAGMDFAAMKDVMRADKKKVGGSVVTFALPCGWGDVRAIPVDLERGRLA